MLRAILLLLCLLSCGALRAAAPPVMLASTWQDGPDVSQYLVSEKLDGVRARWDGRVLWTRAGHRIHAPAWTMLRRCRCRVSVLASRRCSIRRR